jgi:hypothetical protein
LLVSKPSHQVFGQTERQLRDLVHRIGAKALDLYLAEKKRLRRPQCELSPMPTGCSLPRPPPLPPAQSAGTDHLPPGLLRLRTLRSGDVLRRHGLQSPAGTGEASGDGPAGRWPTRVGLPARAGDRGGRRAAGTASREQSPARILRQAGFQAANVGGGYKTYQLLHPKPNGVH